MRVIMTGQVGMDKKHYLEAVAHVANERGETLRVFHVGDMMYAEAPDVPPGRILDLPLSRLHALRRSVMRDVIRDAADAKNVIVNTHATFRWRHGLFRAFDFDQMEQFRPDLLVCLMDNIESVDHRLRSAHTVDATLKDLMVWREEEIMATELLAQALGRNTPCYILPRGRHSLTTDACFRLVCRPDLTKVYLSFPMTHVADMPDVLADIDRFRQKFRQYFICFDPADVDEKLLLDNAIAAAKDAQDFVISRVMSATGELIDARVSVKQVLDIAKDVDGQIYARDFQLIDQADMIVSYIPERKDGAPILSSGVERELHHAYEHGKEVYVVWKPKRPPSPFITETATKVFASSEEAVKHFDTQGRLTPSGLFGD